MWRVEIDEVHTGRTHVPIVTVHEEEAWKVYEEFRFSLTIDAAIRIYAPERLLRNFCATIRRGNASI